MWLCHRVMSPKDADGMANSVDVICVCTDSPDLSVWKLRIIKVMSGWYRKWAATWQNQRNECAPSEDSDQPGHPPSLIRLFLCTQWVAKGPNFHHADSEDADQTGWTSRLIRVFAGRIVILLVLSCRSSNSEWINCFFFKIAKWPKSYNEIVL